MEDYKGTHLIIQQLDFTMGSTLERKKARKSILNGARALENRTIKAIIILSTLGVNGESER